MYRGCQETGEGQFFNTGFNGLQVGDIRKKHKVAGSTEVSQAAQEIIIWS